MKLSGQSGSTHDRFGGPHPVSQQDLRAAFNSNAAWNIVAIGSDRVQTRFHDDGAPAWLATIKRI
jgi:hypothetical protein